jgi:hypothetical protein
VKLLHQVAEGTQAFMFESCLQLAVTKVTNGQPVI